MTGQYFHNIDAKGRLFIPAKLREQLGDTLHVTVGQDGCLSVYSDTEWEKFQQKHGRHTSIILYSLFFLV